MKKFVYLSLSLVFLFSGFFLFVTDARSYPKYWRTSFDYPTSLRYTVNSTNRIESRDRYRPFSNRLGPYQYRTPTRTRLLHDNLNFSHVTRRHDAGLYTSYRYRTIPYRQALELFKATHPALYPRYENTVDSGKIVIRGNDYVLLTHYPEEKRAYLSLRDEDRVSSLSPRYAELQRETKYSFVLPQGFVKVGSGVYQYKNSSLYFRIHRTGKYSCVQNSFESCAISLGKEYRNTYSLNLDRVRNRELRWKETLLGSNAQYPTLTEAFDSASFGQNNIHMTFNALDPFNGSVVRIEAVSNAKDSEISAQVMQNIFGSFRFQIL